MELSAKPWFSSKMEGKDRIIEERKEKVKNFFKSNPNRIFWFVLILLVILGIITRIQPLLDHGGRPGLWDVTTNDYTLGPDLDPFLFLKYAKTMISESGLPSIDIMRNVPLGFDTSTELQMVPYMIVLTYKILNIFGTYSINFAGAFMPVILFALTIIAFFFFVREIFTRKDDKESKLKANIIASISTLFMIVIPGFLSRTVAGIPEKESVGFFFMFLAFYLFVKAWKSENLKNALILGALSGVSTAFMGLSWGGVVYIYASIAPAFLAAILLGKVGKKETLVYVSWVIFSFVLTLLFTNRFSLKGYITSLDTGLVIVNLIILAVHFLLWNLNFNEKLKLNKINLPKPIISLIASIVVIIVLASLILGPGFIFEKLNALNQILIEPIQGRWSTTVAENRQPYFSEWAGSFSKFIFWGFIIGSALLFRKVLAGIDKKRAYILTGFYIFFLFGLIFSRYAPHPALLDGEGFLSKLLYYGSFLALISAFGYYYIKDYKEGKSSFQTINFEYVFLFALFVLTLFTARSAVRLIMVLVPIAPIFLVYLLVEIGDLSRKATDQTIKITFFILAIGLLVFSTYQAYGFYKETKSMSYNYVPNYYTVQWQKAMEWVRENTPQDAVFAHWWDYGYWLQSIGERATVTDGGNIIVWWNYLTGRFVLTGDNQKDALEFLYNHNASYLLIDSTDIGKYGAYSQIGSDEKFDRLSQGPFALISDGREIQETKNETIRVYNRPSGNGQVAIFPLEEDVIYKNNGSNIYLLKENTQLFGIKVSYSQSDNSTLFNQPEAIFVSKQQYTTVPIKYLKYKDKFYDYGSGIDAAVNIIQRVSQNERGVQIDNIGALIYLSPRVFRGMMGQVYILDDPLKRFSNFALVHSEPNLIVDSLNQQGANLEDFVFLNDIQGPIKIWKVNYKGDEKINPEYTQMGVPSYITWKF
ncbi:hypothetical protein J4229_03360 [Candidatus Pacearchaeota archaeon]|nr:hypothetical protein [Candidatus Pacearchaeota archaeon]